MIDIVCVLKDNIPNWETPDGALITIDDVKLTAERANETECIASCEDIKEKDPGSLFKWNCTLKDKNGTVQVLGDADDKLISTVCTGTCATGNTAQSVIDATCKELESGPEWVDKDEKILTEETVDTTWKEECQRCEDIKDKDPGSRFNWTCTLKDKNGTVQVLGDEDNKLISTVCTGTCATGNTAQSVIDATCKEL